MKHSCGSWQPRWWWEAPGSSSLLVTARGTQGGWWGTTSDVLFQHVKIRILDRTSVSLHLWEMRNVLKMLHLGGGLPCYEKKLNSSNLGGGLLLQEEKERILLFSFCRNGNLESNHTWARSSKRELQSRRILHSQSAVCPMNAELEFFKMGYR